MYAGKTYMRWVMQNIPLVGMVFDEEGRRKQLVSVKRDRTKRLCWKSVNSSRD